MIELGGLDAQEKDVVAGFKTAQETINQLIDFQEKIRKEIGKEKVTVALAEPDPEFKAMVETFIAGKLGGGGLSSEQNGTAERDRQTEDRTQSSSERNV